MIDVKNTVFRTVILKDGSVVHGRFRVQFIEDECFVVGEKFVIPWHMVGMLRID